MRAYREKRIENDITRKILKGVYMAIGAAALMVFILLLIGLITYASREGGW